MFQHEFLHRLCLLRYTPTRRGAEHTTAFKTSNECCLAGCDWCGRGCAGDGWWCSAGFWRDRCPRVVIRCSAAGTHIRNNCGRCSQGLCAGCRYKSGERRGRPTRQRRCMLHAEAAWWAGTENRWRYKPIACPFLLIIPQHSSM